MLYSDRNTFALLYIIISLYILCAHAEVFLVHIKKSSFDCILLNFIHVPILLTCPFLIKQLI